MPSSNPSEQLTERSELPRGNDDFEIDRSTIPRGSSVFVGGRVPSWVSAFGEVLIDQELWCLGGDARQRHNNPLREFGFQRERSPVGIEGSTAYRRSSGSSELVVWGWGIGYAEREQGGLFVPRHCFDPLLLTTDKIPLINQPQPLEPLLAPPFSGSVERTLLLFADLCDCLSRYESWIAESRGEAYRQERVRHPERLGSFVPPAAMARAWSLLGDTTRACAHMMPRKADLVLSDPWDEV